MSKQESKNKQWALRLIDKKIEKYTKYRDDKTRTEEHRAYWQGFVTSCNDMQDIIKELDEPEKPTVKQFVADWFEDNLEELDWELGGVLINAFNTNRNERSDFQDWLVDTTNYPIETLIRMKLFGYEVEEEPLYYVKLPDLRSSSSGNVYGLKKTLNGEIRIAVFDKQKVGKTKASQFTENQIKAVDERYWPFAVKVEEE
ncbi:DUF1642 domain-containing protein [Enterococcus faecalis]|uniref:DUF1642 domain-containing protein n=1 Tax=Enterococcus faecalis TaxID=1351 RepID=UPI0001F0DBA2|nr:DUF1642 domain-containing protein [Enterococcus faecalis]EFT44480.1 hypothetical protein HMPREF9500_01587 [Enterococcus faecalis TX0017]EGO5995652.1 DUF1642 domain-containing protein [Enterococcus faecalis]EGO7824990.1 DUF1642 domain-containing protein [Enterococcus faecalis]EGO7831460.1 DUF1642 domain-containing protein [Enterococcus faecalis]EGO8267737.1 DUF1642 domain-containing protein [Enterococcus faecalis]